MAVSFLTAAQRARYGRYPEVVTPDDLARCFHLSDDDRAQIESCRGHHNRLGFALQLSTVRYLGTFLEDPIAVPSSVLQFVSRQLAIHTTDGLERYRDGEQREEHVTKIRKHYGYGDIAEPRANLFSDAEWEATRPIVCRTLGLPPDPQPLLDSMAEELDKTYRAVAQRLPDNPDVRFEKVNGKEELILTPLDALEEPPSLIQLRKIVADRSYPTGRHEY